MDKPTRPAGRPRGTFGRRGLPKRPTPSGVASAGIRVAGRVVMSKLGPVLVWGGETTEKQFSEGK